MAAVGNVFGHCILMNTNMTNNVLYLIISREYCITSHDYCTIVGGSLNLVYVLGSDVMLRFDCLCGDTVPFWSEEDVLE